MWDIITEKINKLIPSSIRSKVSLVYAAIVSVVLIVMGFYITTVVTSELKQNAESDMLSKSNILSHTVSESLTKGEGMEVCDSIIYHSLAGTGIQGIRVDGTGSVAYSTGDLNTGIVITNSVVSAALNGEQICEFSKSDEGITVISSAVPIHVNEKVSGAVFLTKQLDGYTDTVSALKTGLAVFIIIIVVLVGFLSYGMSFASSMPLNDFVDTAREISKGNFNQRITVKGNREIDELAEAMNYMCAELEHIEAKRRNFVSDASHELKTPMATIKLICDSITSTENPDIEMVREFLSDLSDEVDRLTRIIEKLLFLTTLDSQESNITPELVDFGMMLQKVRNKLLPMAVSKNITITLDAADDIQPILLDYDRIWEAVYNIVDNAIKYSKIGGNVQIIASSGENELKLDVIDCGKGIPDEFKERIFERFYRLDDSRARETGGTGLGLSIAKEAVVIHGGRIFVEDAPEGGSCFSIRLPYKNE